MASEKDKQGIPDKLAELQARYFEQLPGKIAEIEATWQKFQLQTPSQFSVLNELYNYTHSLAGSAGTFGAHQLSSSARELGLVLRAVIDREDKISQAEIKKIDDLIQLVKNQSQVN